MSDQEQKVKVSDRRMFTPDGELREEYRFLEDEDRKKPEEPAALENPAHAPAPELVGGSPLAPDGSAHPASPASPAGPPAAAPPAPPMGGTAPGAPSPEGQLGETDPGGPPLELPSNTGQPGAPGFMDLVAMLAEPASIYLGDAPLPDGRTHEDLDMARVHIDLLDVLRQKTAGNLSARESAVLEDVVYQLKMRYVRKQG